MNTGNPPKRVCILIDGGNFHHLALKKLATSEAYFDFDAFSNHLVDGRKLVAKGYYTGTVRSRAGDQRSLSAVSAQTAFLTRLSKGGWATETSKLRRRDEVLPIDDRVTDYQKVLAAGFSEIKYSRDREKGIDVKMAVDLLMGAISNEYDTAIVVSSDRDLLPAIDCVRNSFGKQIEYVGFSLTDPRATSDPKKATTPTIALMKNSDRQRVLIKSDLLPFVSPRLIP
jgi:uncharacterized LabA/DUF88 family protein